MTTRNEITAMLALTAMVVLGFLVLDFNQRDYFDEVENDYRQGYALNLNAATDATQLTRLLTQNDYVTDDRDARAIATHITRRLHDGTELPNLGALNTPPFEMSAATALAHGGEGLKRRVEASQLKLGLTAEVKKLYREGIPAAMTPRGGDCHITVAVTEDGDGSRWSRRPVAGVVVRLKEHRLDTIRDTEGRITDFTAAEQVAGYAITGADGTARLAARSGHYYSVLPVREGYEYGTSRGTRHGTLGSRGATFRFTQREHRLSPFDGTTYTRLKQDHALTVRTPSQARHARVVGLMLFLLAWWMAFFVVMAIDRRMGRRSDHLLLLLVMGLTAAGLLAMFAIAHPLTDRLLGTDMAVAAVWGLAAMCAVSCVNVLKVHNATSKVQGGKVGFDFFMQFLSWAFTPFNNKVAALRIKQGEAVTAAKLCRYYGGLLLAVLTLPLSGFMRLLPARWRHATPPAGMGYLLLSLVLVVLLFLFGTGPEGSDARVNLWFFQPSEVSKFLVVIFIAAFFAANARRIQAFAGRLDPQGLKLQLRTVAWLVGGIAVLLALYLFLLSDMGPALVILVTFILLYAVARKDFVQLVAGVLSFVALIALGNYLDGGAGTQMLMAAVWLVAWLGGWWLMRRQVCESAVMMNLVIMAFLFGGDLLTTAFHSSAGQRLLNRTAMAGAGVWNNDVPGGDQIAQGLWALASGGFTGQGLGQGHASMVPAFHTDMVLMAVGEQMGWVALLFIVAVFGWLLLHCLRLARRAAHPFAFYLVAGIAIVTGVQFFVIALGSLGLIPLTGVSVPLMSYGKSGLIVNLAAVGVMLSVSRVQATRHQVQDINKYDNVLATAMSVFLGLALLVLGVLAHYQMAQRDHYLVKPALVTTLQGERIVEYNPRIAVVLAQLEMGNIYDRHGVLLATSRGQQLQEPATVAALTGAGAEELQLKQLASKRQKRYYPLGDHLFFMLGDYNSRVMWNISDDNPHGYMAENRHLSLLRGFDNKPQKVTLTTRYHRHSPFLPLTTSTHSATTYDYAHPLLLAMLKEGDGGHTMQEFNHQRPTRDLTLSVDARLQVLMQNAMAKQLATTAPWAGNSLLRASVVVLDAQQGDLLASACYPLPQQERLKAVAEQRITYAEQSRSWKAYTDRDLGTTFLTPPGSTAKVLSAMAGLMKLGEGASRVTYPVNTLEHVHRGEPSGTVSMHDAIVNSSNCYFIKLVHDKDLYAQLDSIYKTMGLTVFREHRKRHTPYYYDYSLLTTPVRRHYDNEMAFLRGEAMAKFSRYVESRRPAKMDWNQTAMPWGQGALLATPLNMARAVAAVATDGTFVTTRYVLQRGRDRAPASPTVHLLNATEARLLQSFMQDESSKHGFASTTNDHRRMGGKTGTPERALPFNPRLKMNDAWYVFFVTSETLHHPLAVAVRLERSRVSSGEAWRFVRNVVLPTLAQAGYEPMSY